MEKKLKVALVNAVVSAGNSTARTINRAAKHKSKNDLVTITDCENEKKIIDAVRKIDPHISIWGEETGKSIRDADRCVIVDPLDATTNFVKGLDFYSIIAAVQEEGVLKFGVIYLPATRQLFTAELGNGAKMNGRLIHASEAGRLKDAVISFNRSSFPVELVEKSSGMLQLLMKKVLSWRNLGTAGFEYSLVAKGALDGVVTPMAEAVHAAGYLLMSEAGAKVTDMGGKPISLESETLVAANPKLHGKLLALAQEGLA